MPNYTPNYNLKKPLPSERYNVLDANGNADIIDTKLKEISTSIENLSTGTGDGTSNTGDGSNLTVTFNEAGTEADIISGENLAISFGKILKKFKNIINGITAVGKAEKLLTARKINGVDFDGSADITITADGTTTDDTKAPIDHASAENKYGLGTGTEYGHVKVIDNLDASLYTAGEVLSAKKGYDLGKSVTSIANSIVTAGYKYIIPLYEENLQMTPGVSRIVKIPFNTSGYMPKKVVLFSDYGNLTIGSSLSVSNENFCMELVKESDNTFTLKATAHRVYANDNISGIWPTVVKSAELTNTVFWAKCDSSGVAYDIYGGESFLGSVGPSDTYRIGNFSYDATGISFEIETTDSQFTMISLEGFVY